MRDETRERDAAIKKFAAIASRAHDTPAGA
jgi:hypothetical protein